MANIDKIEGVITVIEAIRKYFPDDVAEFEHAPWDYAVTGSMLLEEPAVFFVHLKVGARRKLVEFTYDIRLQTNGDWYVEKTHINSPKIKS
jgi:hypothetical protein